MSTTPASSMSWSELPQTADAPSSGYGRARLWLGMTGVGFWVAASVTLLLSGAAGSARASLPVGMGGDVMLIVVFLAGYALIQLPFDWLGGYLVPKRFGRQQASVGGYAAGLLRGVLIHTAVLCASGLALLLGGQAGGVIGALLAGFGFVVFLLGMRPALAGLVASLPRAAGSAEGGQTGVHLVDSHDLGFTGGIGGFVSPGRSVIPAAWHRQLDPRLYELAKARRAAVVRRGAWQGGRLAALAFTATGLLLSMLLAGQGAAGTGVGVVETALWFTLWSFLGLLILPSLSRAAVHQTDRDLTTAGIEASAIAEFSRVLDQRQDGEPTRPAWIERIFHPIPDAAKRDGAKKPMLGCCWDVARTSVFLGLGCMSLLTRSVHCNVGRPALWVWLPAD